MTPPRIAPGDAGSLEILSDSPHRRLNLLTGEWVLVSPHRMKRPWQGQVERRAPETRLAHDPSRYSCPGNARARGERPLS